MVQQAEAAAAATAEVSAAAALWEHHQSIM